MNLRLGAAAAAAFIVAALPAAASPAFDGFRGVCGDSDADFAAVKAAADAGHWVATEVQPSTMEGVEVSESLARTVAVGGAKLTVFAWHGTKGAVQVSACTVRVSPAKQADMAADAKGWVGFAPQAADAAKASWQFTETAGARKPVQKSDFTAAAAAGGLNFFTVKADGPEIILDLLKIKS
ncbi:MAG TPA: hypothetical protein VGI30_08060 [Caulobacteraceae bacterium]|jgi:hypothetical protein